jgi:FkbM family methyltransferase
MKFSRLLGRLSDLALTDAEFSALHEIRHLRKVLRLLSVDCVLDVGANAGQYAKMLRERVGYQGLIISIEPNPDLYKTLKNDSKSDNRWIVLELALSDINCKSLFKIMTDDQFSSLRDPNTEEYAGLVEQNTIKTTIEVDCKTLDSIFEELQSQYKFTRPFLKMDTQGNDLSVIAGAQKSLSVIVGIQSELSFKRIYKNSPLYNTAIENYARLGFDLSAMVPNNAGHFPVLVEMDCILIRRSLLSSIPRQ